MITGFNTDIEHGGVTYHVQTEDKGLETPIILSLVYVGGAILASKRTPYDDLIATGFEEKTLTERLHRQHKLICAAIRGGRIEDLKRMGERDAPAPPQKDAPASPQKKKKAVQPPEPEPAVMAAKNEPPAVPSILEIITDASIPIIPEGIVLGAAEPPVVERAEEPPIPVLPLDEAERSSEDGAEEDDTLHLSILEDEGDFRAGQLATIKIYVGRGAYGRWAVPGADVTVKVLGTTFRPMILTTETDEGGVAIVRALLPQFTSGRAAIVLRAVDVSGDFVEVRRIIHQ